MYQHNKSSESKVKFGKASSHCKRVIEAAKLAYILIKQESPSLLRNLALPTFGELPITYPEMMSSASDKAKLLAENFSKNSNLDDSVISIPAFPSRTNLKLYNIPVTPKMVKKVMTNLDLLKASGPDCIPVVVLKNCDPELSYILAQLFNKCVKESCFPDCWKVLSVMPVFKNVGERSTT